LPGEEIYAYIDEKTADKAKLLSHREEVEFAKEYKKKHNGRPWLSYYPHEPVKTFMWPADYIGQEYRLRTYHGPGDKAMNFTLRVVSVRPRVFEVDYFISDEEAKFIVDAARARMKRSSVEIHGENGELVESDTRTSKNAWLDRGHAGGIIDSVYRRVADLLNVHESTLTHDPPNGTAENMQVVAYKNSAHYAPHHDWGVRGGPHTRLATVLLYLSEPIVGGETAFPLAKVGTHEGLVVKPKKGRAVLFYSQFPDGNVDDESLHEARAVTKGEKFLSNVWVHDKVWWRSTTD
jgi:prolyl 4-hydroxylase